MAMNQPTITLTLDELRRLLLVAEDNSNPYLVASDLELIDRLRQAVEVAEDLSS